MTQGYPLAMVAYGIDIFLLIKKLKALFPHLTQPCYADNDGALGTFTNIGLYFNSPILSNPGRGYYPEASKNFCSCTQIIPKTDNGLDCAASLKCALARVTL